MSGRVGCAILAAGASRRLGRPKQLVRVDGVSLVRRTALAASASSCEQVVVILGAYGDEVATSLQGLAVQTLLNPAWEEGIASSVRAAAGWAAAQRFDALLICSCDQVRISTAHLDQLLLANARGADKVASLYDDQRGVPAVFGRAWYRDLGALTGDRGAGKLLADAAVQAVAWPAGAFDLDTADDLSRFADRDTP
jgi:CTP:molybdopterin cytidylyltransferase MocA